MLCATRHDLHLHGARLARPGRPSTDWDLHLNAWDHAWEHKAAHKGDWSRTSDAWVRWALARFGLGAGGLSVDRNPGMIAPVRLETGDTTVVSADVLAEPLATNSGVRVLTDSLVFARCVQGRMKPTTPIMKHVVRASNNSVQTSGQRVDTIGWVVARLD